MLTGRKFFSSLRTTGLVLLATIALIAIFNYISFADSEDDEIVPYNYTCDDSTEVKSAIAYEDDLCYLIKCAYGTETIKFYYDPSNSPYNNPDDNPDYPNYPLTIDYSIQPQQDDYICMSTEDDCYENGWWTIKLSDLSPYSLNLVWPDRDYLQEMLGDEYDAGATYYELFGDDTIIIAVGGSDDPQECYFKKDGNLYSQYAQSVWHYYDTTSIELCLGQRETENSDIDQEIYYTLSEEGEDPANNSNAMLYNSEIALQHNTVLMARTKVGEKWGPLSKYDFRIQPQSPRANPNGGTYFKRDGFTVELASNTEGAEIYYTIDGSEPTKESEKYSGPIEVLSDTTIKAVAYKGEMSPSDIISQTYKFNEALTFNLEEDQGKWVAEQLLELKNKGEIITPINTDKCELGITVAAGYSVEVNGIEQNLDGNNSCKALLDSGYKNTEDSDFKFQPKAKENVIIAKKGDETLTYTIKCGPVLYDGQPDKVTDYFCVASQYTNTVGDYGGYPNKSLRGALGEVETAVSLGNYGGYITYYYENAIKDDPKNPYGVDFIVYGNSVDGSEEFAEPGNILVSENGSDWYTLAGSLHYDDTAIWDYEITYTKQDNKTKYDFTNGKTGILNYQYPTKYAYPLHFGLTNDSDLNSFTTSGLYINSSAELNEFGNETPIYPAFGYADCGKDDSESNDAENPYGGVYRYSQTGTPYGQDYPTRITSNRVGDACDLSWAIDSNGNPVELTNGIHYIKIQTASLIENAAIGEKSTEINMVRVANPADSAVGITTTPTSIKIDGTAVQLRHDEVVDATVDGIFDIAVDAPDTTNVYINSLRSHTAFMDKAPHGIVRVIVQEGEKEPLIYYFKINQNAQQTSKKVTAVTFDTGKGLMQDKEKLTCYFDADTIEHLGVEGEVALPEAVSPKENEGFAYWYNEDNEKQYAAYNAENAAKLNGKTLTAVYGKAEDVEAASAVAEAIENLPEANYMTIEDAEAVKAAQEAYDALTGDQKELVSAENKTKLALASATMDKLEAEQKLKDLQTEKDISDSELEKAKDELKEAKTKLAIMQKTVKKVKAKAKKKSALVSWKKVGSGFTYEVYRSTNPTKSFKKVKSLKKLKVTVKKLKKGKTYYFKVRAFKKVGGKKVYTGWSNIAKVKIKK